MSSFLSTSNTVLGSFSRVSALAFSPLANIAWRFFCLSRRVSVAPSLALLNIVRYDSLNSGFLSR